MYFKFEAIVRENESVGQCVGTETIPSPQCLD